MEWDETEWSPGGCIAGTVCLALLLLAMAWALQLTVWYGPAVVAWLGHYLAWLVPPILR